MAGILLVGSDINARARLEKAAGTTPVQVAATTRLPVLPEGLDLVVLDLDAGRDALIDDAAALAPSHPEVRFAGFYSHVDEALGAKAREAGIEIYPRGRFWSELPAILSGT